jgi:glycerol-3-phosphate acyltransferase PlsY
MIWSYVVAAAGAFFVGAVPFSWLLGKYGAGIDLKAVGSGNPGATNLYRVAGAKWGIPGLMLDVVKGCAPVLAARFIWPDLPVITIVAATAAIAGHIWTPFLGFKGGKGVATAAGAFLALDPLVVGAGVAAFVVVVLVTRYVSLGSIIAMVVGAAVSVASPLVRGRAVDIPFATLCVLAAAVVIFAHRKNISRMLAGRESRWGRAKAGDE